LVEKGIAIDREYLGRRRWQWLGFALLLQLLSNVIDSFRFSSRRLLARLLLLLLVFAHQQQQTKS